MIVRDSGVSAGKGNLLLPKQVRIPYYPMIPQTTEWVKDTSSLPLYLQKDYELCVPGAWKPW